MKLFADKRNTIIIVLSVLSVALAVSLILITVSAKYLINRTNTLTDGLNTEFKNTFHAFLWAASGNVPDETTTSFSDNERECAAYGYMSQCLFRYTSYSDNHSLSHILSYLNRWVGQYSLYPNRDFADLPESVYDALLKLADDPSNKQLAETTLDALLDFLGEK